MKWGKGKSTSEEAEEKEEEKFKKDDNNTLDPQTKNNTADVRK